MSTLADELLNDFEDSGSEGEEEQQNGFLQESATPPRVNGKDSQAMLLDGDEEDEPSDEEDAPNGALKLEEVDDEEEAKAKVEKMQLGGVSDVRTVAGLMTTLEPVLEVRPPNPLFLVMLAKVYSKIEHSPDVSVTSRKLPITKACRLRSRTPLLDLLKTIQNTTFLHKPTPSRRPLTTRSS
ncbi:MAG: hypothetical protein Q9174_004490 [Haloplaca sp. 1 TL-2023]